MKYRSLTSEEHQKLVDEGTSFCIGLAGLAAASLAKFPEEIRDHVLMYLQDHASLYSPFTADLVRKLLAEVGDGV